MPIGRNGHASSEANNEGVKRPFRMFSFDEGEKTFRFAEHSLMRLNQKLLDKETWDEEQIQVRAKTLCDVAKKVWARP